MSDSKELWESLVKDHPDESMSMGRYATWAFKNRPKQICFFTSRYKFCARMLAGLDTVIEIGSGDGFGAQLVAEDVNSLICLDIDETILKENTERFSFQDKIKFKYFDFRQKPFEPKVDGIYLADVIEHIYPEEEDRFMTHLVLSLKEHGVALLGTPNETSKVHSSEGSKAAHVNWKNHRSLVDLGKRYFHNVFLFGMNDEVLHTGFPDMCHYLWILCSSPKQMK